MQPRAPIAVYAARQRGERRNMRERLAALVVIFVLGALGPASADVDEHDAATAMAVPASVSTVVEAGVWGEGGSYRVVVTQRGFEHIYNNVYAQWLSTNGKGESRIEASVQVEQLSNLIPSVIGDIRFVFPSKESKGVFEVDVTNRYSQKRRIGLLHMGKPGELSVELPPGQLVE